jgi:hypothetical protein
MAHKKKSTISTTGAVNVSEIIKKVFRAIPTKEPVSKKIKKKP